MSIQWTAEEDNPMDQIGSNNKMGRIKYRRLWLTESKLEKSFRTEKRISNGNYLQEIGKDEGK